MYGQEPPTLIFASALCRMVMLLSPLPLGRPNSRTKKRQFLFDGSHLGSQPLAEAGQLRSLLRDRLGHPPWPLRASRLHGRSRTQVAPPTTLTMPTLSPPVGHQVFPDASV